MTTKATEQAIKNADVLVEFWKQREADGTIDDAGRKFLSDARLQKASMLRDLAAKDQATGPVHRAMAHSRMVFDQTQAAIRGRGLTTIKSKPKKRQATAQLIGIVDDDALLERVYQQASELRSQRLDGFRETATLKGLGQ